MEERRLETVAAAIVRKLEELGVRNVFGLPGGGMIPLWLSFERSKTLKWVHCKHEAGAAFAATEAHFASGRPTVVCTTAGPGLTNALTGIFAARWEGAKVILLSPLTSSDKRGRSSFQETGAGVMFDAGLLRPGFPCHFAAECESEADLKAAMKEVARGLERPGGFVAHLCITAALQKSEANDLFGGDAVGTRIEPVARASEERAQVERAVALLNEGPFVACVGFGARNAADAVRRFVDATGCPVISTPRAKGIVPERHPQYLGVIGFAGHDTPYDYMKSAEPLRMLVLGSRLSELTSFYDKRLLPRGGLVHVDVDEAAFGQAYGRESTHGVVMDVGRFIHHALEHGVRRHPAAVPFSLPAPEVPPRAAGTSVRPQVLMDAIQRTCIDGADALIMSDAGNAISWCINHLRFDSWRYRASTTFASMGGMVCGALGASLAGKRRPVAVVGDGAMLMVSELTTAVYHRVPATWIVLNDGVYNMCIQGLEAIGCPPLNCELGSVDFAAIANASGAKGRRVSSEAEIDEAVAWAMKEPGPALLDVVTDPRPIAPNAQHFVRLKNT